MGKPTATAILAADATKFNSVLAEAGDKSSKFGNILTGVGQGIGQALAGMAQQGISDIVGLGESAIASAEEQQTAMAKLQAAMTAQKMAYGDYASAIDTAQSAGAALGFTVTDQTNQLGLSVVATKNVTDALRLQRDAMDLARLKGIDLATAELALNKGYDGTTTGLNRMGIQIAKGTSGVEVLAAVEKLAAGQAQAFGDTTAGAAAEASAQFDALKVQVGTALLPALNDLIKTAVDGITTINGVSESMDFLTGKTKDATPAVNDLSSGVEGIGKSIVGVFIPSLGAAAAAIDSVKQQTAQVAAAMTGDLAGRLEGSAPEIGAAVDTGIVDPVVTAADKAHDAAVDALSKTPGDIAKGMRDGYGAVDAAMALLHDDILNSVSSTVRATRDQAYLLSPAFADALKSGDPQVAAQARATGNIVLTELANLEGQSKAYGKNTGLAYAVGLGSSADSVAEATAKILAKIKQRMAAFSPPGPESPLHDIDKWGANTMKAYADGIGKGLAPVLAAVTGVQGPMASHLQASPVSVAPRASGGTGDVHIHIEHGAFIDGPSVDKLSNLIVQRLRVSPAH